MKWTRLIRVRTLLMLAMSMVSILSMSFPSSAASTTVPPTIVYYTREMIAAVDLSAGTHRVLVPESSIGGTIEWMQLVPALGRVFWRESRYDSDLEEFQDVFRSANPEGGDIRLEFGVFNGVIGPNGQKIYYYDATAEDFARVNLTGEGAELLGFGPRTEIWRDPAIDPTGEWLYFSAQQNDPDPNQTFPFYSIFRGQVETGTVEELRVTDLRVGLDFPPRYRFRFDPTNGLIHGFAILNVYIADFEYFQWDATTFDQLGRLTFSEGEGFPPLVTFDPVGRDYYYVKAGGDQLAQVSLFRLAYSDIPTTPGSPGGQALAEEVFLFPATGEFSAQYPIYFLPRGLEQDRLFAVPEPRSILLHGVASTSVMIVVALRRRFFNH